MFSMTDHSAAGVFVVGDVAAIGLWPWAETGGALLPPLLLLLVNRVDNLPLWLLLPATVALAPAVVALAPATAAPVLPLLVRVRRRLLVLQFLQPRGGCSAPRRVGAAHEKPGVAFAGRRAFVEEGKGLG